MPKVSSAQTLHLSGLQTVYLPLSEVLGLPQQHPVHVGGGLHRGGDGGGASLRLRGGGRWPRSRPRPRRRPRRQPRRGGGGAVASADGHSCPLSLSVLARPPSKRWCAKMAAQSEHVHIARTGFFFCTFGADFVCPVGAFLTKFLRRSSGGSLLRVRCWLGCCSFFFKPLFLWGGGGGRIVGHPLPNCGLCQFFRNVATCCEEEEGAEDYSGRSGFSLVRGDGRCGSAFPTNIASVNLVTSCNKVFISLIQR